MVIPRVRWCRGLYVFVGRKNGSPILLACGREVGIAGGERVGGEVFAESGAIEDGAGVVVDKGCTEQAVAVAVTENEIDASFA